MCGITQCKHNMKKSLCRECGTGFCKHKEWKGLCKICKLGFCEHGMHRSQCRSCGNRYCVTVLNVGLVDANMGEININVETVEQVYVNMVIGDNIVVNVELVFVNTM